MSKLFDKCSKSFNLITIAYHVVPNQNHVYFAEHKGSTYTDLFL